MYPSNTILKHVNVLAGADNLPWGQLPNMTPHDTCSIRINVRTSTVKDIIHKQKEQNPIIEQTGG